MNSRRKVISRCVPIADVLACPDCGGRLRLVATISDRPVIEKILAHLGLPLAPPSPAPARSADWIADRFD